MVSLKYGPPAGFLAEEIRSGCRIPERMKEVWAVELDLLQEFMRVCEKRRLRWFAIGGTLLGAVRHGGYIPWDDDIDLIMPREDYDELLRTGPEEFRHPYFFQCPLTEEKFWRSHVQIRNSLTTGCTADDAKKKINHGIFIDVLVLDEVPADAAEREKHRRRVRRSRRLRYVDRLRISGNPVLRLAGNGAAGILGDAYYKKQFVRMNGICASYRGTGSGRVAHTTLSYKESRVWDAADFAEAEERDFEYLKIRVPSGYRHVLSATYGADCMRIPAEHPASSHGTLIFDTNRPAGDSRRTPET